MCYAKLNNVIICPKVFLPMIVTIDQKRVIVLLAIYCLHEEMK